MITRDLKLDSGGYSSRRIKRQLFMLVPVVEGLKHEQILRLGHLLCVVRLQSLECCSYLPRNPRQVSGRNVLKPRRTFGNRKINRLFVARGWLDDCERKIVENGFKVVRNISDTKTEFSDKRVKFSDPHDEPTLSLLLGPEVTEFRCNDSIGKYVRSVDVILGPFEPFINRIKR